MIHGFFRAAKHSLLGGFYFVHRVEALLIEGIDVGFDFFDVHNDGLVSAGSVVCEAER